MYLRFYFIILFNYINDNILIFHSSFLIFNKKKRKLNKSLWDGKIEGDIMINEAEKEIIIQFAKKYKVSSIFLFGSSLNEKKYNDIDLAVKGLKPELFFKFYGELIRNLPKPVDLIDLSEKTLFTQIIEETAVKIYD